MILVALVFVHELELDIISEESELSYSLIASLAARPWGDDKYENEKLAGLESRMVSSKARALRVAILIMLI